MVEISLEKRNKIARRVVQEFAPHSVVNLGIGLPTLCANFISPSMNILIHSENGFLGLGASPHHPALVDPLIVNAGGQPASIIHGGCYFDSSLSFAIIRGGHLDATVLGALEVDSHGNLANYKIPNKMLPGMGGAMDLVVGAKKVIIAMEHTNKTGGAKILEQCTLPLTAKNQVDLIVTELAVIQVTPQGLLLLEVADTIENVPLVTAQTDAPLMIADTLKVF